MMKRKMNESKADQLSESKKPKKSSSYFGDPRLIPRVRQYIKGQGKKNVNVTQMAEDLQRQYGEYGRRKKNAFVKMVEKAYQRVKSKDNESQDSASKLEEKHLRKKAAASISGSDSDDVESIDGDSDASFSEENDSYVQYQDSNAMNNMMSNMYRTTPTTSRTSSPKVHLNNSGAAVADFTQLQNTSSDACITIDDSSDSDINPEPIATSTANYPAYETFCIDRMGSSTMYMKPQAQPPVLLPMMSNMRLLSQGMVVNQNLLQKQATLPRPNIPVVSPAEVSSKRNVDNVSVISDVTEVSVMDKSVNSKPSKTPQKSSKKKKEKGADKEDKKKGPDIQKSTVTFADIGGNESTLMDICKLLVHMKHPEVYRQLGITPPRGFLLHGPPGCGKTLLANAVAGELSLPLIKIAATEVVSGVSGESEEKVRELFDKAVATAPCILFIDEIDAITPKRETASKDMERRIVAQLLSCMDDLSEKVDAPVLVIGATNRPDSLDPALRRAGRFDREISLGIPDEGSRGRILQVLCRELRLEDNFDFNYLSKNTPGYVGADLMALTREAAMTAVNRVFHELQSASKDNSSENKNSEKNESENSNKSQEKSSTTEVTVNGTHTSDEASCENCELKSTDDSEKKNTKENGEIDPSEKDKSSECNSDTPHTVGTESEMPCKDTSSSMDVSEEIPSTSTCTTPPPDISVSKPGMKNIRTVLDWLKEHPPLTDDQLKKLRITLEDFKEALKFVQPSAKREGFATIPDVTWEDIGALHSVREELQLAILAPVRHAKEFQALGLTQAQGILLAGPPGCGKTLLAKAIANESGINFISVKGPELLNMYVGESEKAVRQVFQRGRNSAPCVIFFDEIDALCPKRSITGESGSSVRVVNQLLTEMDGLEERKQVFIMAATNRPDIIDPAILRPGRLDKLLYVGLPTPEDRLDILLTITKRGTRPRLSDDVSLEELAHDERCQGFTGADIAALVREASVCALKSVIKSTTSDKSTIQVSKQHFEEAFTKVKPSVSHQEQKKYEAMREGIRS